MTTRSCVDKCVCEDVSSGWYVRGVCEDTDNGHASGGRTARAVPICINLHKLKMADNKMYSSYLENYYTYLGDVRVDLYILEGNEFNKIRIFVLKCTECA